MWREFYQQPRLMVNLVYQQVSLQVDMDHNFITMSLFCLSYRSGFQSLTRARVCVWGGSGKLVIDGTDRRQHLQVLDKNQVINLSHASPHG